MRRILMGVVATIVFGTAPAAAQELVRVRISAMTGAEAGTIDSTTSPGLFVLDSRIASAELTFQNPAAPNKSDLGPATWQPALTPFSASDPDPAGFIQLTITPSAGESIGYGAIRYTTAALFASNPSSLRLQFSEDGFASTLSTINMDMQRTETVALSTTPTGTPFSFRWEAHDDFGANGGGQAGFVAADVIVFETAPVPAMTAAASRVLAVALFGAAVWSLRRSRYSTA